MFCPEFALLKAPNKLVGVVIGCPNMLVDEMVPKRLVDGCWGGCVVVTKMFGLVYYGFFGTIAKIFVTSG